MTVDGTGYNPTMGATYGQMATYLAARSGLDYHVALNWLRAEGSQQKGNPLGVNYTAAHGPTYYANWRQGLDAAVALLNRSSAYSRILAAIRGRSPADERAAIVASPWSGSSHYGGGAHFSTAGIPGATTGSPPGLFNPGATLDPSQVTDKRGAPGSTGAPAAAGGQVTVLEPNGAQALAGIFPIPRDSIGNDGVQCAPGYVKAIVSVGPIQTLQGFTSPESVPGQANACVRGGTAPGDRPSGLPDVGAAIAALPGQLVGAAVPLIAGVAVLAAVGVLGWSGAKDLLGD